MFRQNSGDQAIAVERGYIQMIALHGVMAESDTPPAIDAVDLCVGAQRNVFADGVAGPALGRDSRAAASRVCQRQRRPLENDRLWNDFVESRAPHLRQQLIERYLHLVKLVVGRMSINLPPILDWDDVMADGTIGLIQAVDRFDPAVGVEFATYAAHRVRGSVIDALRKSGGMSCQMADKAKHLEDTIENLLEQLGRQPSESEIAAALGITLDGLKKLRARLAVALISLDSPLGEAQDDTLILADKLEDRASPNPEELTEAAETRRVLHAAIQELSEKERGVVILYYQDGNDRLTLREVGAELGITGGRAHQLHVRAILHLRRVMVWGRNGATGAQVAPSPGSFGFGGK